jgi:hypothetical protein
MGLNMKESGSEQLMSEMVEEFKFGLMDLDMKDIGRVTEQMEKAD